VTLRSPGEYYPEDYQPELLTEWPVEGDLVIPVDAAPRELTKGMGENWRQHKAYLEEMKKRDDE
jgi:ribonuclease Z